MTNLTAAPPEKPEANPAPPAKAPAAAPPLQPAAPPTSQDIKAIMDGLGRFMPLPWHEYDEISALPPNGLEILEQAHRETTALPELADPEQSKSQQESLDCLRALYWTLERSKPDAQGSYPLDHAQTLLYRHAWESLEALRSTRAVSMFDSLQPYIGVISDGELQSADLEQGIADSLSLVAVRKRENAAEWRAKQEALLKQETPC